MDSFRPINLKNQVFPRPAERGSAVLWVLIIVALFAALNFAFMQNTRSGGGSANITEEKARMLAAELIQQGNVYQDAIKRVMTSNECKTSEIAFDDPNYTGDEKVPSQRTACNIYNSAGGGLKHVAIPEDARDPAFETAVAASNTYGRWNADINRGGNAFSKGGNLAMGKLVLFAPFINKTVCEKINQLLKVNSPSFAPSLASHSMIMQYYRYPGSDLVNGNRGPFSFSNATSSEGCIQGVGSYPNYAVGYYQPDNSYHYYKVIITK